MTEIVNNPIPAFQVSYIDIDAQVLAIIFLVGLFMWINLSIVRSIVKSNQAHQLKLIKEFRKCSRS